MNYAVSHSVGCTVLNEQTQINNQRERQMGPAEFNDSNNFLRTHNQPTPNVFVFDLNTQGCHLSCPMQNINLLRIL